ncbi:MAG: hydrogenase/urease maturation nickel metallochaperone HypA [Candidatus Ratteibacteria bacterium]
MHELSIAQSLYDFLRDLAQKEQANAITQVTLRTNPYSCLSADTVQFLLRNIAENDPLFSRITVVIEKEGSETERDLVVRQVEIEHDD